MNVLEVSELKKSYGTPEGRRIAIVDVPSFTLAAGAQVALQGSSGCGKTTLLNLIAGILQADSGSVNLAGRDIARMRESARDRWRAQHLGYVFQTFNLLQGYTALENVQLGMMFGKGVDRAYAAHLLERVGLADRMRYRPRQLSVGQQQRVAVARALANQPKLVLADEPTGNLDHHFATDALALIRAVCAEQGAALLLVSHDPDILRQFDDLRAFTQVNRAAASPVAAIAEPTP